MLTKRFPRCLRLISIFLGLAILPTIATSQQTKIPKVEIGKPSELKGRRKLYIYFANVDQTHRVLGKTDDLVKITDQIQKDLPGKIEITDKPAEAEVLLKIEIEFRKSDSNLSRSALEIPATTPDPLVSTQTVRIGHLLVFIRNKDSARRLIKFDTAPRTDPMLQEFISRDLTKYFVDAFKAANSTP